MKNREKIINFIREKGRVTSSMLGEEFSVSRQYVHQILQGLVINGEIIKFGSTRSAFYVTRAYLALHPEIIPQQFHKRYYNKGLEEHEVLADINERFLQLHEFSENIDSIFTFGFSEMFNNAIEHSKTRVISVYVRVSNGELSFIVEDSGVGVFRHIMKKQRLNSEIEAIQDLLKGKTTTMPKSHSGEGIFFTSRAADRFVLDSFGRQLIVTDGKPSIKEVSKRKRGTRVQFSLAISSDRHLTDVFKQYTNVTEGSNYGFDKTEIRVKLFVETGVHISRSQARRILSGLEKFKIIVLDFDQVPVVGQAFADEIYRVFQNAHPDIHITEENMSEGVQFMVERAKNEAARTR